MRQSFTSKILRAIFTLGTDAQTLQARTFSESGTNTLTVSGLRMHARIMRAGAPVAGELHLDIFGMTFASMVDLQTMQQNAQLRGPNFVSIAAGDASGTPLVWSDSIINAWIDMQQPEAIFRVFSQGGGLQQVTPIAGTSYPGSVSVASVMQSLAAKMNLTFENNGVNTMLRQPHFFGTGTVQMNQCAEEAGINAAIEDGVLAIWPRGQARSSQVVAVLNPGTGMIGYPTFNPVGITVKTLFNKDIRFGGLLQVTSDISQACGEWFVQRLDHDLASMTPRGPWESTIMATRLGVITAPL